MWVEVRGEGGRRERTGYRKGLKCRTLKALISPCDLGAKTFTYRSYKPVQPALGPRAISFSVTALLCTEEISEGQRCLATRAVRGPDDETAVIARAGQELTSSRRHECECECAFCRWVKWDSVFALLVHLKVIPQLHCANLLHLQACAPAKNLPAAGSLKDLGPDSWRCK